MSLVTAKSRNKNHGDTPQKNWCTTSISPISIATILEYIMRATWMRECDICDMCMSKTMKMVVTRQEACSHDCVQHSEVVIRQAWKSKSPFYPLPSRLGVRTHIPQSAHQGRCHGPSSQRRPPHRASTLKTRHAGRAVAGRFSLGHATRSRFA